MRDGGETPSGGDRHSTLLGDAEGVELAVGDTEAVGAGRTRRDVENCSNAVVRTQWLVYRFDSLAAARGKELILACSRFLKPAGRQCLTGRSEIIQKWHAA
jgi:predicted metal-dependent HD superfamily phosphohydrolase